MLLSFSGGIVLALVARMLVGIGDAATFVSVIRLLPGWFDGRILPQLVPVGRDDRSARSDPLGLPVRAAAAPAGLDARRSSRRRARRCSPPSSPARVVRRGAPLVSTQELRSIDPAEAGLRASLARPGTQLGFWAHLVAGTVPTMLGILWGYPFLTAGLGYDAGDRIRRLHA